MNSECLDTPDVFDRAEHIEGHIVGRDNRLLLEVSTDDESQAAVAAHVIGAILRVVFNDEDQRVVGRPAGNTLAESHVCNAGQGVFSWLL